jgi:hypothetical protein
LLENFSEREMVVAKSSCRALAGFLPDVTASGLSPDIALAPGEIAAYADLKLEKKYPLGQRVLDGLSGARAEG